MLCAECYKEIPACEVYYKEQDTDQCASVQRTACLIIRYTHTWLRSKRVQGKRAN